MGGGAGILRAPSSPQPPEWTVGPRCPPFGPSLVVPHAGVADFEELQHRNRPIPHPNRRPRPQQPSKGLAYVHANNSSLPTPGPNPNCSRFSGQPPITYGRCPRVRSK